MNSVQISGYLTADPELKTTTQGTSICKFRIGVQREYAPNGETDFINCVAWKKNAEFIAKYFCKSKPIEIRGSLEVNQWKDNNGNNRENVEVKVDHCGFALVDKTQRKNQQSNQPAPQYNNQPNYQNGGNGGYVQGGQYNGNNQYNNQPNYNNNQQNYQNGNNGGYVQGGQYNGNNQYNNQPNYNNNQQNYQNGNNGGYVQGGQYNGNNQNNNQPYDNNIADGDLSFN